MSFDSCWCEVGALDGGTYNVCLIAVSSDGFTEEIDREFVESLDYLAGAADRKAKAARYMQARIDGELSDAKALAVEVPEQLVSLIDRNVG